ncbi:hypothetical protein K1T71_013510 [Dendrolimus kikuchii]|uniref:Uncharacterized protein n=1 Tax=Dendrolimus kikuchii TaxID=765133 RepID=A0ACC1CGM1_9NEOP|nr:hypothetical protein K1T71_013510 [Dendrolimus kikuchii]
MRVIGLLSILVVSCLAASVKQQRKFPDDFIFGTATASYQIEGAWDEDGKGENIWDYMTHNNPTVIKDLSNGDIAADTYHNYKRDVEMMRELGLDAYRFSLSWARILPTGFSNNINQAGIDFYNNYINEMLKYNIQPMITLYHWDLPQKLQELGGFSSPLISDWFEEYARVAYESFGDRVKFWITFNEPREVCYQGYGWTTMAPMLNATGVGTYICAKHLVLCHAKAYHLYNNEFRSKQNGIVGITYSVNDFRPLTDSDEDIAANILRRQGEYGIYSEPIFGPDGGFPKELAKRVAEKSAQQGYAKSRMPEFTDEERKLAKGASDFMGINHYTGYFTSAGYDNSYPVPSFYDDLSITDHRPSEWPLAASSWLYQAPDSLFNTLAALEELYPGTEYYITENGWSVAPDSSLVDDDRIRYYRAAWENLLDAIDAGFNLKGYMAWSLMDNFEWMQGYTERFGLYHVDFEDPARTRTPRKSAFVYKELLRTRVIDYDFEPESMVMTIDKGH